MKKNLLLIVLALATAFSAFSQQNQAQDKMSTTSDKGLIKVTILYPYSEGKTFDMDYYEKKHMPYVAGLLGSNLVRYTIEKGVASGMPNSPLPFMAIGSFYVKSINEYQAALAPNIDAIRADFPKYTNVIPTIQISEVVR